MNTLKLLPLSELADSDLVDRCRAGHRDAFGSIVARYQSLICSLAYNATGSLSRSEDLAQDTFLAAWSQMNQLREPSRLRSWLCGIARNVVNNFLRKQDRQPVHLAATLEHAAHLPSPEAAPAEQAISREEEAILWRSIENIPITYREPLILFYRQHQSVGEVAATLELGEDAVKQRLARGRKLLQDEVASFVEGALRRSAPGHAFTVGVIAALPLLATSATAATLGATAAKGSAVAKAAGFSGLIGAILGPVVGVGSTWFGIKASLQNAQSEEERRLILRSSKIGVGMAAAFCLTIIALSLSPWDIWAAHPQVMMIGAIALPLAYCVFLSLFILRFNRRLKHIRRERMASMNAEEILRVESTSPQRLVWRSRPALFGWPLVDVSLGRLSDGSAQAARGWIAIGDVAYGLLIAAGGVATGPIALGGAALGLVAIGGAALGVISFAGVAVGGLAIGGAAIGWLAFGALGAGGSAAMGGAVVAREVAVGYVAIAPHVNDATAQEFFAAHHFFSTAQYLMQYMTWLIWLPMLLVVWQVKKAREAAKRRAAQQLQ